MAIDRRNFLIGSVALLGAATASRRAFAAGALGPSADFVSAARLADGSYAVLLIADDGSLVREIPLSTRGHDIAIDRGRRRAAAFARRPGYFAVAFDLDGRGEPHVVTPEDNRHFFGHGAFSHDGRLLYTSENDIDLGTGVIGIYETSGWRRIGEFSSFGIGPHEALLLADGRTLAIANGGFATEPSSGREPINLSAMEPSLCFVDVETGELKAKHLLPAALHLLSIRHLAADAAGGVWFGGQWQGSLEAAPELIGMASRDRPIKIIEPAEPQGVALKGYIGSVSISADGRVLAASAPRAGRIIYSDTATGKVLRTVLLDDGCGIAPAAGRESEGWAFAMTSGHGVLHVEGLSGAEAPDRTFGGVEFDNHLRRIAPLV
ncbi:MAG: DUF1513 domain-containing protein [Hyphomicrobium sp.]